jgi:iron complex outermembrane receptor protein
MTPLSGFCGVMRPLRSRHFRALLTGAVFLAPFPCLAADATPGDTAASSNTGSGEVVVTAQRRSESITRTPIAISAFGRDFITERKLDDIKDLITYTPGFAGNSDDSWIDGLAIRGIVSNDYGVGGDPSVSIFKDGVWQGRTGSAVTSMFDIARAEALRGPQGFLFGRNAISGAISVITEKPKIGSLSGHVYLGYGEVARKEGEAAINLPAGDHWAFRLAGYHVGNQGWVDNVHTPGVNDRIMGQNKWAGRFSALYQNGPLQVVATVEGERRHLDGTPYRAFNDDREVIDAIDAAMGIDLVVGGGPRDVDTDLLNPREDGHVWGANVQADLDLGFATLTSISAYRQHRFFYSEDYDGTPLLMGDYLQHQHGSYMSQELRLVSRSGGRLTWSAGLSAYREKVTARYDNLADENFVCLAGYGYESCDALTQDLYGIPYVAAPGGVLDDVNIARSINTGLSAYADANYELLPKLQAGIGLRYTWDRKRFGIDVLPSDSSLGNIWTFSYYTDGFLTAAKSWRGATPRLYVRYQWTPAISVYASLTRGYKAGGFGSFTVDAPGPEDTYGLVPPGTKPDDFAPETIWSKEAGIKGNVLGHRLQFDLTGFHYVYRNLQTVYFDPDTRTQQVINVGKVHGLGLEASATFKPARLFDVTGNLAYTHTAKSGDRDCTARDCGGLPNPIWASSGVATFHYPIGEAEAFLAGEWTYQGRTRPSFDWRGITRRKGYHATNLRLGYKSGGTWEVEAYVQNLFDATYYYGAENGGDLTPSNLWGVAQPRNFGVNLRWRFGE